MRLLKNLLGVAFFLFCLGYVVTHKEAPAAFKGLMAALLFWFIMYVIFTAGKK